MMEAEADSPHVRFLGRYALHSELASGGMATIHLGRLLGPVGFARTVAIKRLHAQYAKDPQFVAMFLDEARLAARIRHQNVVPTLDVVALKGEIFLVMEYVHGESLSRLLAATALANGSVPPRIAVGVMLGVLHGLHAAHEAKSERGVPLDIVHRDVSPQNVLVAVDGVARVVDFGIAKAAGRLQTTGDGALKGKMAYMSPEQLLAEPVDRRTDIWAASVVLWEMLVTRRLFRLDSSGALVQALLEGAIEPPSLVGGSPPELDPIVLRGLATAPEKRFQTAREMALALEQAHPHSSAREIADWVEAVAGEALRERAAHVEEMESEAGAHRSSDGSLRKQLAVLGFGKDTKPVQSASQRALPSADSETPTEAAPGRISRSDAQLPEPPTKIDAPRPPPPPDPTPSIALRPSVRVMVPLVLAVAVAAAVLSMRAVPAVAPPAPPSAERAATAAPTPAPAVTEPPAATDGPPRAVADASDRRAISAAPVVRLKPAPRGVQPDADSAQPDCDPPYVVGPPPDFIRHPKRECLPP